MTIPAARQPVVEKGPPGSALFTRPWYLFLQELDNSHEDPITPTITASPFSYTATDNGFLIVTGGTVSLIEYGRNSIFTNTGLTSGIVPLFDSDTARITYTVAPTVTFIRR